jgi:hypothetical protein
MTGNPGNMKLKVLFSLFLMKTIFLFSQVTPIQISFPPKNGDEPLLKPPVYDSTRTLEEQYKLESQDQFIGLQLFLPPVVKAEEGPVVFSKASSGFEKGNKFYTITDILQGNYPEQLKQLKSVNQCGYKYKDPDAWPKQDLIIYTVFVLKENSSADSSVKTPLYWVVCQSKLTSCDYSSFNAFLAMPYFEKQKKTYQHQSVIRLSDKSKWLCTDVKLMKGLNGECRDSTYQVFCLLSNDKGEELRLSPPSEKSGGSFMTEKEYIRLDHANRNQKEELFREEKEKEEKHKAECIRRFGQHNGELVALSRIEPGMTAEMCRVAWGTPWDISQSNTSAGNKEVWFYSWRYKLYFEEGLLVKTEH